MLPIIAKQNVSSTSEYPITLEFFALIRKITRGNDLHNFDKFVCSRYQQQ